MIIEIAVHKLMRSDCSRGVAIGGGAARLFCSHSPKVLLGSNYILGGGVDALSSCFADVALLMDSDRVCIACPNPLPRCCDLYR